jgi:hypothetical protein
LQVTSEVGNLTITGDFVDTTAADAVGTRARSGDHGHIRFGAIHILRGDIVAAGVHGAGIGAGYAKISSGLSGVGALLIQTGDIFSSATNAAGIGIGSAANGI